MTQYNNVTDRYFFLSLCTVHREGEPFSQHPFSLNYNKPSSCRFCYSSFKHVVLGHDGLKEKSLFGLLQSAKIVSTPNCSNALTYWNIIVHHFLTEHHDLLECSDHLLSHHECNFISIAFYFLHPWPLSLTPVCMIIGHRFLQKCWTAHLSLRHF